MNESVPVSGLGSQAVRPDALIYFVVVVVVFFQLYYNYTHSC